MSKGAKYIENLIWNKKGEKRKYFPYIYVQSPNLMILYRYAKNCFSGGSKFYEIVQRDNLEVQYEGKESRSPERSERPARNPEHSQGNFPQDAGVLRPRSQDQPARRALPEQRQRRDQGSRPGPRDPRCAFRREEAQGTQGRLRVHQGVQPVQGAGDAVRGRPLEQAQGRPGRDAQDPQGCAQQGRARRAALDQLQRRVRHLHPRGNRRDGSGRLEGIHAQGPEGCRVSNQVPSSAPQMTVPPVVWGVSFYDFISRAPGLTNRVCFSLNLRVKFNLVKRGKTMYQHSAPLAVVGNIGNTSKKDPSFNSFWHKELERSVTKVTTVTTFSKGLKKAFFDTRQTKTTPRTYFGGRESGNTGNIGNTPHNSLYQKELHFLLR